MSVKNDRYCNGFPTLRRNSDPLNVPFSSVISDVFSPVPIFSGHKNGHSRTGKVGAADGHLSLFCSWYGVRLSQLG